MNTRPPSQCPAWRELERAAAVLRTLSIRGLVGRDPARRHRLCATAPGIRYDYAFQRIDDEALALLQRLADERDLAGWRTALLGGEPINSTERRAAWHTALRAGDGAPQEVRDALERLHSLAARLRCGAWRGATGLPIRRIIHLGTGGSDLGPRLLVDALREQCAPALHLGFSANIDPLDLARATAGADPQTTLFVVVSKTFTTQETMENAHAARGWLAAALPGGAALDAHFVAVTANVPAARDFGVSEILPMWDWVGGRYSIWSPVGFSAACMIGADAFDAFLAGAREMDEHFANEPWSRNVPVLMALLGIWNVNFLHAHTHAVLPYSTALRLLPAYLQQLEMESNGKGVDREDRSVDYATAPVIWGAEGTVGQHSFHQLLHQGTPVVPADFLRFEAAPGSPRQRAMLASHAAAQAEALALGQDAPDAPAHRRYPGNRPSSTIHVERLDARNLGRLLALYEHKVFAQGIVWNLNSFDQWGVEYGKQLAARILRERFGTGAQD